MSATNKGRSRLLQTARENDSSEAFFHYQDLKYPFGSGGFHLAARGKYTKGIRAGEACVCKWLKKGDAASAYDRFDSDIRVSYQALDFIEAWNERDIFPKLVKLNIPEVWTFDESSGHGWAGVKYIQEPFIRNFQKFNCSGGWVTRSNTPCSLAMQALSHFSYHVSDGKFLLCDIQGGEYADTVVLADPLIHSSCDGSFADGDLGPKGISNFFGCHKCNEYCNPSWRKPKDQTRYDFYEGAKPAYSSSITKKKVKRVKISGGTTGRRRV